LRLLAELPDEAADCAGGRNVSALAERLGLSQPTVSNHLARLRTLGIVKPVKRHREEFYYIDQAMAQQVLKDLQTALKLMPSVAPEREPEGQL
jgi:DNA-binding transcriptional ArsR family regulator